MARRFFEDRLEGIEDRPRLGRPRPPPEQVAEVKVIACELPATVGLPLPRFARTELHRLVIDRAGLRRVALDDLALALTGRDQALAAALVAVRARSRLRGQGGAGARPLCAPLRGPQATPRRTCGLRRRDEKSQLQALGRRHATLPPAPGRAGLVEFDYRRGGTLAYLAA